MAAGFIAAKWPAAKQVGKPSSMDVAPTFGVDAKAAEEDFGFTYVSYEQSVLDWAEQILAFE